MRESSRHPGVTPAQPADTHRQSTRHLGSHAPAADPHRPSNRRIPEPAAGNPATITLRDHSGVAPVSGLRIQTYNDGARVILEARLADPNTGEPVEPSRLTFTVKPPASTPRAVTTIPGTSTATIDVDEPGMWWWAVDADGDWRATGERRFYVRPRQVAR